MNREITLHIDAARKDFALHPSTGFLIATARATRTGVFDYSDGKGGIIRELRSEEEVFHPDSLESLKFAPITRHHPDEMVTVDNVDKFMVGLIGDNVHRDGDFVSVPLVIKDKKEIKRIQDARAAGQPIELSCGYDSLVKPIAGEHPSEGHYDCIQTQIRYNHLSTVDRGRAGKEVKIIFDEMDNESQKTKTKKEETKMKIKKDSVTVGKFSMDAIHGEVADEGGVVARMSDKLDDAIIVMLDHESEKTELTKKADELQGKLDAGAEALKKAKDELDEYMDPNSPKIEALLAAKKIVLDTAEALEVKGKKEDGTAKTMKELKIDIISATSSEKFDAEGKSDAYLDARVDQVVELIAKAGKEGNKSKLNLAVKKADDTTAKEEKSPREKFLDVAGEGGTLFKDDK